MWRYLLRRLGAAVFILVAIIVITFILTHVIPGDPIVAIVGQYPAPPEYIAKVKAELGLDRPLLEQLWLYLVNLVHGNLGYSFANRQPVLSLIMTRAVHTLILMIPALVLATIAGVAMGTSAAPRAGRPYDSLILILSLFGYSVPVFWLGQILLIVFAVHFGWLPVQGMYSLGQQSFSDLLRHLILPGFCVTIYYLAIVARVSRASLVETLREEYMITALAKGLRKRATILRHALPNAMIPVVTVIGYNFGFALTGAILTETVFGWPGIGLLFYQAIGQRDYSVLEGIFVLAAVAVVIVNLLTDLTYARVDPRVRVGAANG